MLIKIKKTVFNIIVMVATIVCMILMSVFAVDFSSIFYILISGVLGLSIYLIKLLISKKKKGNGNDIS